MLVSIRVIVSCCVLIMSILFAVHVQAENSKPAKKIPKWKQEHMARVANAAKVCGSPTLNPKLKPNDLTTNFYQVNLMPDEIGLYLGVEDGKPILGNSSGKTQEWLLSRVGAGLYKVSACVNEAPLCLTTTADKQLTLAACDAFGYGDQVWWLKGYAVGANKGGWFLGNDGVGQMECLIAGESANGLVLENCTNEQNGWRFNDVSNVNKAGSKKKSKSASLGFPNGAEIIAYQCNSGASVSAYYDESSDEMTVRYNGQTLNLKSVVSGSGAKFGGENQPWGWWTKGDEGLIYQSLGDEAVLESCFEVKTGSHMPNQPARVWEAENVGDGAVVADCTDCEEDHALVMRCKKDGLTAEVDVWLNVDSGFKTPESRVAVSDGDDMYQFPFEVQYLQMTDENIVSFEIHKNHHSNFIAMLQAADNVTFKASNAETTIGMVGSNKAINQFKTFCGW